MLKIAKVMYFFKKTVLVLPLLRLLAVYDRVTSISGRLQANEDITKDECLGYLFGELVEEEDILACFKTRRIMHFYE